MNHEWPGNVRELRNVVERAAVLAKGPIITPAELDLPHPEPAGEAGDSLRDVEKRHIAATLRQHNWNISRTAKALGIDRVTLYNKIKRYEIRENETNGR
jgi:DNA-binding NtrC family response regulator